jgi:hypothetical protein
LLTDGEIKYPKLIIEITANGQKVDYADEQMKRLFEVKNYFSNSNSRRAILDIILANSNVPFTALKTGTYQNKEGNVTVGVSYLNQLNNLSYDGVNQYFVSFRKLSSLNNSELGYSTLGAKIALENVVKESHNMEIERLKNKRFNQWKNDSQYGNNTLFESKIELLYDDIIEGKYGSFKRLYELDGAFKQINMNYKFLFDENAKINLENVKSMLNQYEKNLSKNNLIIDLEPINHELEEK